MFLLFFLSFNTWASKPVIINSNQEEYEICCNRIDILKDTTCELTFKDIRSEPYSNKFMPNNIRLKRNNDLSAAYWIRFTIKNPDSLQKQKWLFEFFDSSIEDIVFYKPDGKGGYVKKTAGNDYPFYSKIITHKNFEFLLPPVPTDGYTCYARIKSDNPVFMYGVLRSYTWFTSYAIQEYYGLGLFYGILLAMAIYNLLMYLSIRERSYIYYVLYIISTGLYCLALDGTGFQFLWPSYPSFNDNVFTISRFLMVFWVLLYSRRFLAINYYAKFFYQLINTVIILRVFFFLLSFTVWPELKNEIILDAIPLFASFLAGIIALWHGFKPARYFVAGFLLLFTGFLISNLTVESIFGFTIPHSIYTVYSLNGGTVAEMMLFSFALSERIKFIRVEREKAQNEYIDQLQENQRLRDQANYELETKVQERTNELQKQKQYVEKLYSEVQHNIKTARLIQFSLLPGREFFERNFQDSFVLYRPKDIVSGDFYWVACRGARKYVVAADCTGHGVAGAFMSFIGYDHLNYIYQHNNDIAPGKMLEELNECIIEALRQRDDDSDSREGIDISVVCIDEEKHMLQFAGARNSLYMVRGGEFHQVRAERISLGMDKNKMGKTFPTHDISLQEDDMIYLFTDGFADQLGGSADQVEKIKYPRFRSLLIKNYHKNLHQQKQELEQYLDNWRGEMEQTDDILVMGIKVRLLP